MPQGCTACIRKEKTIFQRGVTLPDSKKTFESSKNSQSTQIIEYNVSYIRLLNKS